jgi:hypothetical protein
MRIRLLTVVIMKVTDRLLECSLVQVHRRSDVFGTTNVRVNEFVSSISETSVQPKRWQLLQTESA